MIISSSHLQAIFRRHYQWCFILAFLLMTTACDKLKQNKSEFEIYGHKLKLAEADLEAARQLLNTKEELLKNLTTADDSHMAQVELLNMSLAQEEAKMKQAEQLLSERQARLADIKKRFETQQKARFAK